MSYILDALKKSESERNTEQSPTLYSQHSPVPSGRRKKSRSSIVIITVCLLSAGLGLSTLSYVLLFKSPSPNDPDPQDIQRTQSKESIVERQTAGLNNKNTLIENQNIPAAAKNTDTQHLVSENQETLTDDSIGDAKNRQEREQPVMRIEDLPENIRQLLPDLHLAGHTYSKTPQRRLILINNSILREGDFLGQDFQLKEISINGVIFDFHGTLFSIATE